MLVSAASAPSPRHQGHIPRLGENRVQTTAEVFSEVGKTRVGRDGGGDVDDAAGRTSETLGRALAHRVVGVDSRAHVIGNFGGLRIAEANVSGTSLVGKTFSELDLRYCPGA